MPERTTIPRDATVYPETVTEVSRRVLDDQPVLSPGARHRASYAPRNGVVETRTLAHPKVWATALKRAGGDVRRIKVHSWTRVEILD